MTLIRLSHSTLRRAWPAAGLAALVACGSDTPSRPTPVPTPGVPAVSFLSGKVLAVVDNRPVEDAAVVTVEGPVVGRAAVSDAEGRYSLGELPSGTYSVKVEKQGHGSATVSVFVLGPTERVLFLPYRVPEGTFLVAGVVSEPGGLGIDRARVSVIDGTGAGQSITTDQIGRYVLLGLRGNSTLRVEAEHYVTKTERLVVDGDRRLDVELAFVKAPAALAGTYELTLEASPSCLTIPEPFDRRTYSATTTQRGSQVQFAIGGAPLAKESWVNGRILGDEITLVSQGDDWYYGHGIEEIVEGNQLGISFSATGRVRQRRAEGLMSGEFVLTGPTVGRKECRADDHRFSLVPK